MQIILGSEPKIEKKLVEHTFPKSRLDSVYQDFDEYIAMMQKILGVPKAASRVDEEDEEMPLLITTRWTWWVIEES